jgi:hypothetical protein
MFSTLEGITVVNGMERAEIERYNTLRDQFGFILREEI